MKNRDIIIVTSSVITSLVCIALTFWGNYKNNGVLSPDAFYGILATFIGVCATIIVGFQIASFVKVHETEQQMKEVQKEREKMKTEKEEFQNDIKSIRKLLSNALTGLSLNTDDGSLKIFALIWAVICDYQTIDCEVALSRYKTLVKLLKKTNQEEFSFAASKLLVNLKKMDIPKDTDKYTEIMKLHLEVIEILKKAADKEEKDKNAQESK